MLHAATMAWADKHGGNGRSLQFVEIPFPQMDAALASHRLDAAVMTEPYASAASGDTRVIGSAEDGVAPTFMTLGWFATANWLNAHTDAATRFIAAVRKAAEWGNSHHAESAAILSRYSKIPVAVTEGMGRSVYGLTLDPKLIQAPIDIAARYGFIDHSFPAADLMWFPPAQK
jgi:NitT/TauT family transport system substrate-binding protein